MDISSEGNAHAVIKKIETNCVASSSKKVYLNSILKFFIDLCKYNQSCLEENHLKESEEMGGNKRKNHLMK